MHDRHDFGFSTTALRSHCPPVPNNRVGSPAIITGVIRRWWNTCLPLVFGAFSPRETRFSGLRERGNMRNEESRTINFFSFPIWHGFVSINSRKKWSDVCGTLVGYILLRRRSIMVVLGLNTYIWCGLGGYKQLKVYSGRLREATRDHGSDLTPELNHFSTNIKFLLKWPSTKDHSQPQEH